MFLNKNYVLGNELCAYLGINQANLSILRKERELQEDFSTVQKLSGTVVVDLSSRHLPNNFRLSADDIVCANFTEIHDKLPLSYIKEELNLTEAELKVLGAEEVLVKYQNLKEIKLWKFPEYLTKLRNPIPYTLNAEEYEKCLKNKQIAGGVKLKPSKYFVWYFLRD